VYNLSDLIFHLSGVEPIKVRKSKRDPDSPLVRLSFRDVLRYCYLKQERLDSSFFRLEDSFKRLKSMDVMRFVRGLYSDRLNELDASLVRAQDEQRAKREAVEQIRKFLRQFQLGTDVGLSIQLQTAEQELGQAKAARDAIERDQSNATHTAEPMRVELRSLASQIAREREALTDLRQRIGDQTSLRSELITAKVKAGRAEAAGTVLAGVEFGRCPRCGTALEDRPPRQPPTCLLCGVPEGGARERPAAENEILRRELNTQMDDLADSIARHERAAVLQERQVNALLVRKSDLDQALASELARYDSAFVANVRAADRRVATLEERISSLKQLARMPAAIQDLEREAGELQGSIDVYRSALVEERDRLRVADTRIKRLEETFFIIMREVGYPGVYGGDRVQIDPRRWMPVVIHGDDEDIVRGFFDAGSGGKKTLFNVCYALAVHQVALEESLPLPTLLIIDSPTKNISRDINAELVASLYRYIFKLAALAKGRLQLLLIDSDLAVPEEDMIEFSERLMAHDDPDHPPLFSYYVGP
jgi:hypothetical protein